MLVLEQFEEKALSNETQFEIMEEKKHHYFVKFNVGAAVYVYQTYAYNSEITMSDKFELCAIVSGGKVYLTGRYTFYPYKEENYPSNTFDFGIKVDELNRIISNELFPQFYNSLPIRALTESEIENVKRDVRSAALYRGIDVPSVKDVLKEEEVASLLTGKLYFNNFVNSYFDKRKNEFINIKSKNTELKRLVETKYNIEQWEIELANNLKNLDAVNVTVTFNYSGNIGAEKVEKRTLLDKLYRNDYFSSYYFVNGKSGEKLLEKLGLKKHDDKLRCENIVSVTYGKKVIFSKENATA